MAKLDARQRASLPDSAFAYIDSSGKRRLPIHDEAHARNALARFNQVRFESPEARELAFRKLLKTAIGYGIAPVGFVAAEMRSVRSTARPELPTGQVTFLLSDIEGSTALIAKLGDAYPPLLEAVQELIRTAIQDGGGLEVDSRADEFFAVFSCAADGLEAAIRIQREMGMTSWPTRVKLRIGLHSGAPARTETGYVGLAVNTASRICSAGHGGQVVASAAIRDELDIDDAPTAAFTSLGLHKLHGLPTELELFSVEAPGLEAGFPPPRLPEPH